jgi:halocyanin-like protein
MTPELNRRELLGTAGAGVAATLAGCGFLVDGRGVPGTEGSEYDGSGDGNGSGSEIPEGVPEAVHTWMMNGDGGQAAKIYASEPSAADMTGQDSATVAVGAGNGFAFDPPVMLVTPGTEITFEWTGAGGSHNVVTDISSGSVPVDIELNSGSAQSGSGVTYSYTFENTGVAPYVCIPHRAVGMMGAVIVVESGSMDSGSDS